MKPILSPTLTLAFILLGISSCHKSNSDGPPTSTLSFNYNSQKYVLPFTGSGGANEWFADRTGLFIGRPDLFGGNISFEPDNCAYLDPYGNEIQRFSPCQLSRNSQPIDSVAVFIYESGSLKINTTNCKTTSETDFFTGNTIYTSVCDITGSFNLTLKNKEDSLIVITDGVFARYRVSQ